MAGADWSVAVEIGGLMQRELSVHDLLTRGFEEVECWVASEERIHPPRLLPDKRGVYAFALGEQIVYVGLASRSLKQRLGFYARPGVSQRTNIRLNGLIRELIAEGKTVRVLIAHPEDGEWRGFRLSGPEGLEAALIEDFNLPWNIRGSIVLADTPTPATPPITSERRARGTVPKAVLDFVAANPHCTQLQIARGVFGPAAVQPQANSYCRKLEDTGKIERLPTRPATYILKR